MFRISRIFLVAGLAVSVMGCEKEDYTLQYLLQHPLVLEKEFNRCQALQTIKPEQQAQCEVVNKAATQIAEIITQQHQQPEKFGLQILDAEMDAGNYATQLTDARNNLDKLTKAGADDKKIKSQQDKVNEIQQKLADKRNEIKTYLAVLGLSTPE